MTAPIVHRTVRHLALMLLIVAGEAAAQGNPRLRQAPPRPGSESEALASAASNRFSLALLRQLNAAGRAENIFVSPFSAALALGMTSNGAVGTTGEEMRRALGFADASQQAVNEGSRGLLENLSGEDSTVELRIANAIFHERSFPFDPGFLQRGKEYFGADIQALDFASPASVRTVNDWANRSTNGKIPSIVERFKAEDVMIILNAVYFNAKWEYPFDPRVTRDTIFHAASGARERTRLMNQWITVPYFETPDVQGVELPYGNGAFAMTILLPRPDRDVNAIIAGLNDSLWMDWHSRLSPKLVDLSLPKLRLEYQRELNDDLKRLGIDLAFRRDVADFTGMSPLGRRLYIAKVLQKTFIEIDEEKTEAAAVTGVTIGATSMPRLSVMRVDRPFIMAIRDRRSGTILFVGKIVRIPVPSA